MRKKFHIRKGDQVRVIAGNHKGQEGKVVEVLTKKDRAIVEGVNMISKHVKPSATNPQGGITKTEAGLHVSNLMVIDNQGNATRVGRKAGENGKLVRYSIKSGEELK
jgi:large subunit ribosomal protein L24